MTLDLVHDLQEAYRLLLQAFSFPGRRRNIGEISRKFRLDVPVPPTAAILALTLLDAQTTAAAVGPSPENYLRSLSSLTSVRPEVVDHADFIFLTQPSESLLVQVLGQARRGTLANPHGGSTILVPVDRFDQGPVWTMKGPGIPGSLACSLPGSSEWIKARSEANAEFPLGIDLIFFDDSGELLALPRTTRITEGGC